MHKVGQVQKHSKKMFSHKVIRHLPHSFANVVKGTIPVRVETSERVMKGGNRKKSRMWLKESWYREVFSMEDLLGLEGKFKELGIMDCYIRYLGGKDVGCRRWVWLKLYGVPLHVWTEDFFKKTTREWGLYMASDVRLQVDGVTVPVWVVEGETLIDGHDIICGSPAMKDAAYSRYDNHTGKEGSAADLSITLQKGPRVPDDGAGMGFF
ncbi:hypothetical protein Ancab_026995 [Ancistrocladus abbreviatus]